MNFMIPVDEYRKSERATKYGFLVIGLTFLLFFLVQTLSKIPIHPFQYLMIGLAEILELFICIKQTRHYLDCPQIGYSLAKQLVSYTFLVP